MHPMLPRQYGDGPCRISAWGTDIWVRWYKQKHERSCLCSPSTFGRQISQRKLYPLRMLKSYSASHDNWCTETLLNRVITAQWEGMEDVGSARYEPALLPPCPTIRVSSYNNCQRSTHSSRRAWQFKCLSNHKAIVLSPTRVKLGDVWTTTKISPTPSPQGW